MNKQDPVISQLTQWADSDANIRALILTSSRAAKHRELDFLSDYDVEVFAKDTAPFTEDDSWLLGFGEIMVRWPARPQVTGDENWITQLALFKNRVRIDFKITSQGPEVSPNLSSGYKVLVDKDGLSPNIPAPSFPYETIQQPSASDFESRMVAFWWDIVYVAKGLFRRELNYAKAMLDDTIRFDKLLPLLNWYIGVTRGWNINTGLHGKWLDKYLDKDIWQLYQETFADADLGNNWSALYSTIELFRKVSVKVAERLDFQYPYETDCMVTAYIREIENAYHEQTKCC